MTATLLAQAFGGYSLVQIIVIAVATVLMMLAGRSQRPIVPFTDAPAFVATRQQVTLENMNSTGAVETQH